MGAFEIALMLLPTTKTFDGADSRSEVPLKMRLAFLLPGRHAALQFFEPVEHNVDVRRCRRLLLAAFEHQETPAVRRHVEVRGGEHGRLAGFAEGRKDLVRPSLVPFGSAMDWIDYRPHDTPRENKSHVCAKDARVGCTV